MYRLIIALVLILAIALAGWAVAWFDETYSIIVMPHPGVERSGFTFPAFFAAAIVGGALLLTALGGRIWQFFAALPGRLRERNAANRKQRGYEALTKGLAAVAAGDAKESASLAQRSTSLLKDQRLTALLSAQSAQLQGKEDIATGAFKTLLEDKETAFLGLRGLAMQALRQGKEVEALRYVKEAQEIKPNAPWVLDLLYQLELRDGNALGSADAVKQAQVNGLITRASANHRLAPLFAQQARKAMAEGQTQEALNLTGKALEQTQGYLPAVLTRARALLALSRNGQAKTLISRTWKKSPHPDLMALYLEASDTSNEKKRNRAQDALLKGAGRTRENLLAMGEVALGRLDFETTKRHLNDAKEQGSVRADRLLDWVPQIESALVVHEDADASALDGAKEEALRRVAAAMDGPSDNDWLCGTCGSAHDDWNLTCHSCSSVGTVEWQALDQRKVVQQGRGLIERSTLSSLR